MAAHAPPMVRRSTGHGEHYVGQFRRLESIGKGSFAIVYRAVHPADGSLLAIKTVQTASLSAKLKQNLTSEIDILKSINHPHIVALVQCLESTNHIHLVMEFCQLGDLATFVKKRDKLAAHPITADMMRSYPNPPGQGFNEVVVRHFSKQLSSALEFLRSKNLVHRDLKPQNLLLNPPQSWIAKERPENRPFEVFKEQSVPLAGIASLPCLKIADFGFARHLPTTTMAETLCGSPLYMAPEILRYEKYDAKADLWSVGTVLYELMVGRAPFKAANHVDLLRKIERTMDRIKFPEDLIISDDMKVVIRGLLRKMPTERMSWEGYFQSAINTDDIPGLVPADRPKPASPVVPAEKVQTPDLNAKHRDSTEVLAQTPRELNAEPSPESPRTVPAIPLPITATRSTSAANSPKRPALVAHATAPINFAYRQERGTPSDVGKPKGRETPSPAPSEPKILSEREREREREREQERLVRVKREKALREVRDRAAQDVADERDYVVVEKRAVEVNAFADELAASPQVHGTGRGSNATHPGIVVRRATTQAVPMSTGGQPSSPTRQMQLAMRPDVPHGRKRSWEAKYPPTKISATSAIAAALNTVNFRLTGGPLFPSFGKGPSPPQPYTAFPSLPTPHSSPLLLGDSPRSLSMDEDTRVVSQIEERATRSDVVWGFAEVKYKQLTPIAPSNDNMLGMRRPGQDHEGSGQDGQDDDLTNIAVVEIAEEALVLYVKTLAILQNTFDLAGRWWNSKNRGEVMGQQLSVSPRAIDGQANQIALQRVNNVVQWARARFNECLEKSEYARRRLTVAQQQLPPSHPGHPRNHPSASTEGNNASDENLVADIHLSTGVTAEKLMYERALEMNRSAAVNELLGEDLPGCELSYATACRLLEAVLEKDDEQSHRQASAGAREGQVGDKDSDETVDMIEGIDEGDRQIVLNIIATTKQRLASLRQKIAVRNAARRNSLKGPPTSPPEMASPQGPVPASLPARLSPSLMPH